MLHNRRAHKYHFDAFHGNADFLFVQKYKMEFKVISIGINTYRVSIPNDIL